MNGPASSRSRSPDRRHGFAFARRAWSSEYRRTGRGDAHRGRAIAVVAVAMVTMIASGTAEARPASTGWYAEGGLGAVAFLPEASDDAAVGPALDLRVGRDLFSWLAVGITVAASSHEATVPPPPEGEWFQLYRGGGDARITLRLDRFAIFVEGGAGAAMISSNVLGRSGITDPGENVSITFHGGAGVHYQLENRHYAIGLAADGFLLPQFDAIRAVDARLYLRYTY